MILSDFELIHYCKPIHMRFFVAYSCAAVVKISTDISHRAVPLRQLCLLSITTMPGFCGVIIRPHHLHVVPICGLLLHTLCVACIVCLYVLGTRVNCAKTAELIEMPYGGQTRVDPRNLLKRVKIEGKLYGGPIGSHQRSFKWYHLRPPTTSSSPRLGFTTPNQNSDHYYRRKG